MKKNETSYSVFVPSVYVFSSRRSTRSPKERKRQRKKLFRSFIFLFFQTDNLPFTFGFTIRTHGNTRRTCVTDHHSSIIAKVDWWTFNIVTLLGTPDMVVADLRILCYNWDGEKKKTTKFVMFCVGSWMLRVLSRTALHILTLLISQRQFLLHCRPVVTSTS